MEITKYVIFGEICALVFTGKEKLWISSRLIEVSFDLGRPSENLDYKHKGRKTRKIIAQVQVTYMLTHLLGEQL